MNLERLLTTHIPTATCPEMVREKIFTRLPKIQQRTLLRARILRFAFVPAIVLLVGVIFLMQPTVAPEIKVSLEDKQTAFQEVASSLDEIEDLDAFIHDQVVWDL